MVTFKVTLPHCTRLYIPGIYAATRHNSCIERSALKIQVTVSLRESPHLPLHLPSLLLPPTSLTVQVVLMVQRSRRSVTWDLCWLAQQIKPPLKRRPPPPTTTTTTTPPFIAAAKPHKPLDSSWPLNTVVCQTLSCSHWVRHCLQTAVRQCQSSALSPLSSHYGKITKNKVTANKKKAPGRWQEPNSEALNFTVMNAVKTVR